METVSVILYNLTCYFNSYVLIIIIIILKKLQEFNFEKTLGIVTNKTTLTFHELHIGNRLKIIILTFLIYKNV